MRASRRSVLLGLCVAACTESSRSTSAAGDGAPGRTDATVSVNPEGGGDGNASKGNAGESDAARLDAALTDGESSIDASRMDANDGARTPPGQDHSVLERNNHASRDGAFVEPLLTLAAAAKLAPDTAFQAVFAGSMLASPLYWERGPGGKGLFFAVTTGNDVFALDETSGATVWRTNIGQAAAGTGLSCGSIHPIGIISTPVIDASTGTLYVAGAIGASTIERHEVHALSVLDGSERPGFPVVVHGQSGGTTFTAQLENQRSALALVNGILYVAYGGHSGDCGAYHGWVVAIDTANPARLGSWATLGQGEGIWSPGGMASDGSSIFAVTGNSTVAAADHMTSDSEEVVRLTGLGVVTRDPHNLYFPSTWRDMDARDSDLSASNAMYVAVPGSTPSHLVVALSKDGQLYLLDPANLGGMGGHLVTIPVAAGGASIHTVPAAYETTSGVHIVLSDNAQGLCPAPRGKASTVLSVLIQPGAPPKPAVVWCAPLAGPITGPIATTTDGKADAVVWYMNGGKLTGVDGDTGKPIFDGGSFTCDGVRQWTSPIVVKGRVVVGGDGHLCSWSPH